MITLEDCLGLCDLSEEEILAIAEHDRLPEIAAIAKGQYLLGKEHGTSFGGSLRLMASWRCVP